VAARVITGVLTRPEVVVVVVVMALLAARSWDPTSFTKIRSKEGLERRVSRWLRSHGAFW